MSKNALVILSSPRKGSNSSALGRAVAQGFIQAGGQAEIIDLSGLDIKPCLGCGSCQRNGGKCAQVDGMTAIYPKIKAAQILILATPVYWFNMSAQLKIVLDRCYALLGLPEADGLAGKNLAAAFSYGDKDMDSSGGRNAVQTFQDICNYAKIGWAGCVHGSATERDSFAQNEELLREARALGEKLFQP